MKAPLLSIVLLLCAAVSQAAPAPNHIHGRSPGVSTYMQWDDAVALGNQILAEKHSSLGDVAREYRARKAREQSASPKTVEPKVNYAAPVCPPPRS
jgi:hypothetical protein